MSSATDRKSHIARKKTKILVRLPFLFIIIIILARLSLLEQQGEVQAGVEGGLPSVQPPPQAQTGSMLKRPLIFSKASQILIFPLSVSGLRQELFPDAITAKRPLSDPDHSLPGLLSIHCCFVDLKERVLHIWVG